jgi:16S rRNA (cytosine967-C5)-methyltransferase
MTRSENQLRTFEALWTEIAPHVRTDRNLPARIQQRLAREKRFGSRDRRLYRELLYTALRYLPWLESSTDNLRSTGDLRSTDIPPVKVEAASSRLDGEAAGSSSMDAPPVAPSPTDILPAASGNTLFPPAAPLTPLTSHTPPTPPAFALTTLWLSPTTPATAPLKQHLLSAHPPRPATIAARAALLGQHPAALLPEWFRAHCPAAFETPNIDTLHTRAPLWLRLQTDDPAPVFAEFTARGWTWRATPARPDALELLAPNDPDLTQTESYRRGLIEIQDLGSQLILPAALPHLKSQTSNTPLRVLDACAGAGGKTLQLAKLLGPAAQIDATDPRPAALAELRARAARAALKNIRIIPQTTPAPDNPKSAQTTPASTNPKSKIQNPKFYDIVVADAPCSGSGTWRRHPHLKYTTRESDIRSAAALQLKILAHHAPLVRPGGGVLIYATCSLSRVENEDVISAFLAAPAHRDFTLERQTTILPADHNTDGFFTATLRRH